MQQVQQQLSEQILQQHLPHALLLVHHDLSQIQSVATWLQTSLLCQSPQIKQGIRYACGRCKHCLLQQAQTHADVQWLTTEQGQLGVDAIRQANQFLQKTPQLASAKILVIEQAEQMTVAAANALLKTLEEPTASSYLILGCKNHELLLPTIVSRCQLVRLPRARYQGSDEQTLVNRLPELADAEQKNAYQNLGFNVDQLMQKKLPLEQWLSAQQNNEALLWLADILATQVKKTITAQNKELFEATLLQSYDVVIKALADIRQFPNQNQQWRTRAVLVELYQQWME